MDSSGEGSILTHPRIYLDHAATSWPKDEAVLRAMYEFARECGSTAGRGSYQSSMTASQVLAKARKQIGQVIGAPSPDCISLHSGGTTALNAAIHGIFGGLLEGHDSTPLHVVTTAAEHNSVLRPLHHLARKSLVRLSVVSVDGNGVVDASELMDHVEPSTVMVAVTSASNVTGCAQPISQIGESLSDHPALFLCDAAQSFGWVPIDAGQQHIDLLAAPGHKASGGPSGTGFLYVDPRLHEQIQPSIQGGTGSVSESLEMPTGFPDKLEAGNLNVPAIAGWNAALAQCPPSTNLLESGDADGVLIGQKLHQGQRLHQGLRSISGVNVLGQPGVVPIASFQVEGFCPGDVATILDTEFGIEVRSGLHCAAMIHACIGSSPDGTVRISAGPETTCHEMDQAIDAVRQIASSL
jgi:selenocysteine lyase/cysteine desulfurase